MRVWIVASQASCQGSPTCDWQMQQCKYAVGDVPHSLCSISCPVLSSESQEFWSFKWATWFKSKGSGEKCDICAANFIQMILILNKLELVEPDLHEEAMFRVCKLPARVRFALFADSLCLRKVRKNRGSGWGEKGVTWTKWGICLAGSLDNEASVFQTWGVNVSPTTGYEMWVIACNPSH